MTNGPFQITGGVLGVSLAVDSPGASVFSTSRRTGFVPAA